MKPLWRDLGSRRMQDVVRDLEIGQPINFEPADLLRMPQKAGRRK